MKRFVILITCVFLVAWIGTSQDFTTGGLSLGSGKAKILPVAVSADGKYFAYLELFSPPSTFPSFQAVCTLNIIDVRKNSYASKPLSESEEKDYLDVRDRSFDSIEYTLAKKILIKAKQQLDTFRIVPGLQPVRIHPFTRPGEEAASTYQKFELLSTEQGTSGGFILQILPNAERLLDLRVSIFPDPPEPVELILQKDTKLPSWREAIQEYAVDEVYLYEEGSDKLIVVFLKLRLSMNRQRYMCVTGSLAETWKKIERSVSLREAEGL